MRRRRRSAHLKKPNSKRNNFTKNRKSLGLMYLETRTDAVLTKVSGQIIRNGIFQDKAFTEAIAFSLKLKLQRNPNMVENGRFPTAVKDFNYETTR